MPVTPAADARAITIVVESQVSVPSPSGLSVGTVNAAALTTSTGTSVAGGAPPEAEASGGVIAGCG
jgi:hypothetical protein